MPSSSISHARILEDVPIAMDSQSVRAVLQAVTREVKIPIGVKLPPYNNTPKLFEEIARTLLDFEISYIATINSEPLTLDIDLATRTKVIRPNEGFGGLGRPSGAAHRIG
jgi:dihydroorotate dehydrogenase